MSRLSIAVCFIFLLVGCCGTQTTSVVSGTPLGSVDPNASGGQFSPAYAGSYSFTKCLGTQQPGSFSFQGTGSGQFIFKSSETGSMQAVDQGGQCKWTGKATLANTLRPKNSITFRLTGARILGTYLPPCGSNSKAPSYTVTGGTGKFAHASGSGIVKFTCKSDGTYTDQWVGMLQF